MNFVMEPEISEHTIVLIGSWNLGILTPQWVGMNVFKQDEVAVEMLMQNASSVTVRLKVEGLSLQLSNDRLVFTPNGAEKYDRNQLIEAVCNLLEGLPLTPVKAIGLNYGFVESPMTDCTNDILSFSDDNKLAASGEAKFTEVKRGFLADNWELNLKVMDEIETDCAYYQFNFHFDVQDAKSAKKVIEDFAEQTVMETRRVLRDVYEVDVEWE